MSAFRAACFFLALIIVPGVCLAEEPLKLGVHPYLPATELVKRFRPLAEYLERKTGRRVEVVISNDYEHHIYLVGHDRFDISYMGPASYVMMVERYGKKPLLARQEVKGKPVFRGVIITRDDSPIRKLSDLRGKRFAFGDPDSTMSHLVPRYMLIKAGIGVKDLGGHEFLRGHHNVALGVLVGDFDAGAVKEEVFYEYKDRGLRALEWTPEISEHLFVASKNLPAGMVKALRDAMLALKEEPEGKVIMSSIKAEVTAFDPVRDRHYATLRRIIKELEASGITP